MLNLFQHPTSKVYGMPATRLLSSRMPLYLMRLIRPLKLTHFFSGQL
jgi:hypothetical protein